MRVLTVGTLIDVLKEMPQDAEVWTSAWNGSNPIDRLDLYSPFHVYEKDGVVRLYIDDGEASHPDIDEDRGQLLCIGDHWDRVREVKNQLKLGASL
jgi:hypothetical protein